MPGPLSETVTRTASPSRRMGMRTAPPSGEWERALSIRFSSTRSTSAMSASTIGSPSPASMSMVEPRRSASSLNFCATSLTSSASATGSHSGACSRASSFASSKRSPTRRRSRSLWSSATAR